MQTNECQDRKLYYSSCLAVLFCRQAAAMKPMHEWLPRAMQPLQCSQGICAWTNACQDRTLSLFLLLDALRLQAGNCHDKWTSVLAALQLCGRFLALQCTLSLSASIARLHMRTRRRIGLGPYTPSTCVRMGNHLLFFII